LGIRTREEYLAWPHLYSSSRAALSLDDEGQPHQLRERAGHREGPDGGSSYIVNELSRLSLENAYRGDWVARKIVDVPAQDATREWRLWQAAKPEIEKLEEVEKNLRIQQKTKMALIKARLYGGACMVMGVDDGLDPSEPLEPERVTQDSLKFVHVLSRYEINAGNLIEDLESEWYGEPSYYERTSTANGQRARLHPSRVVRFIGAELPDPRARRARTRAGATASCRPSTARCAPPGWCSSPSR
jgi:phage-related protein (TIGR01555 family)